jgi:hypothetical protein
MPLTTASLTWKPKADAMYVAWNAFFDTELDRAVRRGQRLRGDDPAVVRHRECFVEDGEAVPEICAQVASQTSRPEPEATGTVKVRMIGKHQRVIHGGREYRSYEDGTGDRFEVDAATVRQLVDSGVVEVV